MVKLTKRPLPPKPITAERHYRNDPNFSAIVEDCFGKCYICENDNATTLNVEHRISHRGDDRIKYDWNNLFLSCGHCNNIKIEGYRKEPELGYDAIIKKGISRSSAFAAFKRGIVRNDAELSATFGELIV